MGNIGRTCLLITIALAWALPVGAQVYNFHTYRELDGLPSNTVRGIVQDDDGVLWIATARGVSRYDGETWVNETQFGRRPGTYVSFIAKAADGRLWAHGAGPSGLLLIRGDDGWRVRQASPSLVREGGFAVYDLGRAPNGETLLTAVSRQGEVALFSETEDRVVALPDRQAEVNAVLFHDEGLLLATDRGLYVLDLLSLKFHRTEVTRPIHAVCAAEGGEIWYVGSDWIGRGPVGAPRVVASGLPIKLEVPAVGVVATADRAGGIYFADLGQVHYYHPDIGLEFLTRESGLAAVGATDIMVDREGLVWFTGLRGISKLVSRSLAGYDQRHGLYDNEVSAIEFLPDGGAVLGHIGGLTLWGDQPRRISFAGDNEVLERVTDLATDPQGRVWFAADNLGIGRLEADGRLEFEGGAPGTPPRAYSLLFDAEGRQWVGTNYQVLRQGDDGVLAEVPLPGLPHAMIRRLVQLADGTICIVTAYNGLFLSRDGAITKVRSPSYRAEQTYGVFERSPGEILVGTVEGLYVLDGDGLRRPGRDLPAIARPVYVILADREGRLWFGTDNGVLRWSAAGLDHFTAREGLLGADVNRDAMKLAADGSIWIGTDQGLNIHQPAFEDRGASAPTVTAGAVVADGMALAASGRYTLNRPPRQLEFGFHGVSFRDERRNRYQTRLEGFESAWQGPAAYPGGTVRYTNLPPGTYRLHVRMVAADGSLSPVATSGEVVIRPEVSDRWWFRALVLAGVLAGLLVLSLYVSGRRYARRLQGQVRDRTASLELSETRFRSESRRLAAILGSISDGVIALDDTGRVVLANAAAERLLGGGRREPGGSRLVELRPRPAARAGGCRSRPSGPRPDRGGRRGGLARVLGRAPHRSCGPADGPGAGVPQRHHPPRAGEPASAVPAARVPGRPGRRHRPRLQQPADHHHGQHLAGRGGAGHPGRRDQATRADEDRDGERARAHRPVPDFRPRRRSGHGAHGARGDRDPGGDAGLQRRSRFVRTRPAGRPVAGARRPGPDRAGAQQPLPERVAVHGGRRTRGDLGPQLRELQRLSGR